MDPNLVPDWPTHNNNNNGDDENQQNHHHEADSDTTTPTTERSNFSRRNKKSLRYWVLLLISYTSLVVGSISSTLLSKFYFNHKGSSKWVSTWVQSAGFPLLLIPIYFPHFIHFFFRSSSSSPPTRPFSLLTRKLFIISVGIGFMLGLNNFLFSWGVSYLPASTASLLLSSQLAFNLILSVIIVKQKITFSNFNCVILLTVSSILLALTHSHDKPSGVTRNHYFLGFFSILGAGLLFALYLPLVDMVYRNVHSYEMVLEMQLVMEVAATVFATVGMAADGGFGEMKRESDGVYDLGRSGYWLTIGFSLFSWQLCFIGTAGLVFLTTSLNGGICMTAILPMNVLGGVWAYGDAFGGAKAISTVLCVWGFCSYLYGEYIKMKQQQQEEVADDHHQLTKMLMMGKKNQAEPPDDDRLQTTTAVAAVNRGDDIV